MPKKHTMKKHRNKKARSTRLNKSRSPSPSDSDSYSSFDEAIPISESDERNWYAYEFDLSPTPPPNLTTPGNQKERRRDDKGRFSKNNVVLRVSGLPSYVYNRTAKKSSKKKKRKGKKGGLKKRKTNRRRY